MASQLRTPNIGCSEVNQCFYLLHNDLREHSSAECNVPSARENVPSVKGNVISQIYPAGAGIVPQQCTVGGVSQGREE